MVHVALILKLKGLSLDDKLVSNQIKVPAPQTEKPGPVTLIVFTAAKLLGGVGAGCAAGRLALLVLLVLRFCLHSAVGHAVLGSG